ncbi:hypothetical protein CYMTET_49230 [Cymbomonas tetramitiformis]|uniref:Uncharacterized protein n=1 Tax=Cymbomonas tetramitiformis TaxID=36881 RepID=A0AAE0BQL6_9CHLO|nr:hypothetical protein CYMTET_49230 [Cymbomonas tetramitiformis]
MACCDPCCDFCCPSWVKKSASYICERFGNIGFAYVEERRSAVTIIGTVALTLSVILCICGTAAISTEKDTVKNVNWAHSDVNGGLVEKVYIGLSSVVVKTANGSTSIEWDDNDCESSHCTDCKDAATSTDSSAIIACLSKIPAINALYHRRSASTDSPIYKFIGSVALFVGTVSLATSLASFKEGCYDSFQDSDSITVTLESGETVTFDHDLRFGPGYECMAWSLAMNFVLIVSHLLLPVKKVEDVEKLPLVPGI